MIGLFDAECHTYVELFLLKTKRTNFLNSPLVDYAICAKKVTARNRLPSNSTQTTMNLVCALLLLASEFIFFYHVQAIICPTNTSGFLVWDEQQQCTHVRTSTVCNQISLNQIPDLSNHLPVSMVCSNDPHGRPPTLPRLFDQSATRKCLTGKKLCVLGDSTIEETIHDMVVLLSGIGNDVNRVKTYFDAMIYTNQPTAMDIEDVHLKLSGSGRTGDRAHRVMNITIPLLNFSLYHHFTGHRKIEANGEGITALLYRLEDLFPSKLSDCNILLMNSAAHDFQGEADNPDCQIYPQLKNSTCLQYYMPNVTALHRLVDRLYKQHYANTSGSNENTENSNINSRKNVKVFWKGDAHSANIAGFIDNNVKLDLERKVAYSFRHSTAALENEHLLPITFINITGPLSELPFVMHHARIHHIGQHSKREQSNMPLLWSSVSTQVILNSICREF